MPKSTSTRSDETDGAPSADRPVTAWLEMDRAEKVPEIVAGKVLREIVQRGMVAGDRLPPEAAMLEQFGVGRASLREALRILEAHGLIRIKPGPHGGPVVTDAGAADYGQTTALYLHRVEATFQELREARLVIEPIMARMAAERLTERNAERIREALALGWDAVDGAVETWSKASEAFHGVIAGATGNRVLDLYASALVSIERKRVGPLFSKREDRQTTMRVHQKIADAILGGDAAKAERLTRRHIQALLDIRQESYPHQLAEVIEWR